MAYGLLYYPVRSRKAGAAQLAALAGTYLALLDGANDFDFSHGADSIAISGHKFIGSPIPCGVVIVKKNYRDRIGKTIPYMGTIDTTITGSRNGHSPVFL